MATRLGIYNAALLELGVRQLAALTEPVESRRILDQLWDANLPKQCLEQGAWNFAARTVKSTEDSTAPAFGYTSRHTKPGDWVRTLKVSAYDSFEPLLDQYSDEGQYWFSDLATLYIQYVSSHPTYGGNLDRWPESFTRYVALKLAGQAAPRLLSVGIRTQSILGEQGILRRADYALKDAKNHDALNQPIARIPYGTWVRSRNSTLTDRRGTDTLGDFS